ncbi:MAG: hypothetical protein ACON5B_12720 [Myxococcota bacterium]
MTAELPLPPLVRRVGEHVAARGGRALLVGGSVRDHLLGHPLKDWDIECYGLSLRQLERALRPLGRISTVGRAFSVLKLHTRELDLDISLPRRDSKVGPGHKGIQAVGDPTLDPAEAARRRDLTVNAIMVDILDGHMLDPWNGKADLDAGILRPVDVDTFLEDPLRAVRAVQFAGRLGFEATDTLKELCRRAALHELPKERLLGEWQKLWLKATSPSLGLRLAEETGILQQIFPEAVSWSTPQALTRIDRAAVLRGTLEGPGRQWVLMTTAWLYDAPAAVVEAFFDTLGLQRVRTYDAHRNTVACHAALDRPFDSPRDLRWLSTLTEVDLICRVHEAAGRDHTEAARHRAAALGVLHDAPPPLVQGRDLLKTANMSPGPHLGTILKTTYAAQLDGVVEDVASALDYAIALAAEGRQAT